MDLCTVRILSLTDGGSAFIRTILYSCDSVRRLDNGLCSYCFALRPPRNSKRPPYCSAGAASAALVASTVERHSMLLLMLLLWPFCKMIALGTQSANSSSTAGRRQWTCHKGLCASGRITSPSVEARMVLWRPLPPLLISPSVTALSRLSVRLQPMAVELTAQP